MISDERLLSVLGTGEENARTNEALAERLDDNPRAVRNLIEEARGYPIASSVQPPYGYFLCRNWAEANKYQKDLLARILGLAQRKAAFKRACQRALPPEQLVLGLKN